MKVEINRRRFAIASLMFFFAVGSVFAGSGSVTNLPGAGLYLYAHPVNHTQYGKIEANNHLNVKSRDENEIIFSLTTIDDEYHECFLEGKAKQKGGGKYEYRDNKCRLTFSFGQSEVSVRAAGTDRETCKVYDLSAGHGCGFNTSIGSGIYKKAKKTVRGTGR